MTNNKVSKTDGTRSLSQILDQGVYHQMKYRWVILITYILAALANSLPAQAFSSINTLVQQKFHFDKTVVTLNTLIFPIVQPFIAFPVNWILDKYGMAIGCFGGGILLIIGVWMRTFIQENQPIVCLLGSVLAAIGNTFILNSPTILATNWFKPISIPGVISLAVLANLVSLGFGASLPGLILKKQSSAQEIKRFLRIQALCITIPIVLLMIFLRNKPKIPPSKSAGNQGVIKQKYIVLLKKLFQNREYLKIMLAMIFSYGTLTSYLAILDQCIASIDSTVDSGQVTGLIILSAMLTGVLATIFFIFRIRYTLQYRQICMICLGTSFVNFSIVQLALCLGYTQSIAMIILGISTRFFALPITAMLIAYASECVFPLGQGSAAGYLFASSSTFGFVVGIVSVSIIDKQKNTWITYLILIFHSLFYLFGFIVIYLTKQQLNRTKFELANQNLIPSQHENLIIKSTT